MHLPCAPPHPHHRGQGCEGCVPTCREQHGGSSSMLIVASWEEINKAIKGDITVCLPHHRRHSLPPSPPSAGSFYGGVFCWRGQSSWGEQWSGDPWLIRGRRGSFRRLTAGLCCQGSKALAPVKSHRCPLLRSEEKSGRWNGGLAKVLWNRGSY